MSKKYTIGLLSGTSVDAIDGILVSWDDNKPTLISSESTTIPEELRQMVFDLSLSGQHEIEKIQQLDREYAKLFSASALHLCTSSGISPKQIFALGSHGQTIRHYPPSHNEGKLTQGFSLQIGDPNIIAEMTQITTVADFRRRDVAAGGHGAPLAPSLHNKLFRSSTKDRIIINTGGIANITYLPKSGETIGFDTGPANGLMDSWCQLHQNQAYDVDGKWAACGNCQTSLLDSLLKHPYFSTPPPKSTGPEEFNLNWLNHELSKLNKVFSKADVQATLLALSTETIASAIEAVTQVQDCEVYICGGGAFNSTFYKALKKRLKATLFDTTEALGIPPEWVEAVCFAWLAKQTMEGKTSNLPSVTGARKEVVLGGIYPA